jgi:hypothetical protein
MSTTNDLYTCPLLNVPRSTNQVLTDQREENRQATQARSRAIHTQARAFDAAAAARPSRELLRVCGNHTVPMTVEEFDAILQAAGIIDPGLGIALKLEMMELDYLIPPSTKPRSIEASTRRAGRGYRVPNLQASDVHGPVYATTSISVGDSPSTAPSRRSRYDTYTC